jgi:hypothetical protein
VSISASRLEQPTCQQVSQNKKLTADKRKPKA